jgi:hypothetical protein
MQRVRKRTISVKNRYEDSSSPGCSSSSKSSSGLGHLVSRFAIRRTFPTSAWELPPVPLEIFLLGGIRRVRRWPTISLRRARNFIQDNMHLQQGKAVSTTLWLCTYIFIKKVQLEVLAGHTTWNLRGSVEDGVYYVLHTSNEPDVSLKPLIA